MCARVIVVLCLLAVVTAAAPAASLRLALAQTALRVYQAPREYSAHMAQRMQAAMACNPQLVLFPEDIGLPLALIDDYALVKDCQTSNEALAILAQHYSTRVGPLVAEGLSPARALCKVRGPRVDQLYRRTFSRLARRHHVYIVAGSAPVPYADGLVANMSYLFGPSGEVLATVGKTNLIPLEGPQGLDLRPVPREELPTWQTPLGCLATIICADAWDEQIAAQHRRNGAQVLLNCLANPEPWSAAQQVEMDRGSLPARVCQTGLPGVQCYAVGQLFELGFRGRSQFLRPDGHGGWEAFRRAKSADREEIVAGEVVF